MPNDTPQMINTAEVARRLGISPSHAWDLAMEGEFGPVFDVSGKGARRGSIRVYVTSVDQWLEGRRFPQAPRAG